MKIRDFEVGDLIGETPRVRLYLGQKPDKPILIKLAKTFEDNEVLSDEAGKFNRLKAFEQEVSDLQRRRTGENAHYDWLFASLENSFMEPTQGDRWMNVYSMPETDPSKLVPLPKLRAGVEIDVRTSVWILGRLFKFYSFFELLAASGDNPVIEYPKFSAGDYFIGPERHRVIYANYSGEHRDMAALSLVREVTQYMLDWVVIDRTIPEDVKYQKLLEDLSGLGRATFEEAHKYLYDVAGQLWGIKYYPFTYRSYNTTTWKKIKEG